MLLYLLEVSDYPKRFFKRKKEQQSEGEQEEREEERDSRKLSDDDKIVIKAVFKDEINSGKPAYKADIKLMSTKDVYLAKLCRRLRGVKPIYHHIQYKSKTAFHKFLDETGEFKSGFDSATRSLYQQQWSTAQASTIEARFATFDETPKRREVNDIFKGDEVLHYILEVEGG